MKVNHLKNSVYRLIDLLAKKHIIGSIAYILNEKNKKIYSLYDLNERELEAYLISIGGVVIWKNYQHKFYKRKMIELKS